MDKKLKGKRKKTLMQKVADDLCNTSIKNEKLREKKVNVENIFKMFK